MTFSSGGMPVAGGNVDGTVSGSVVGAIVMLPAATPLPNVHPSRCSDSSNPLVTLIPRVVEPSALLVGVMVAQLGPRSVAAQKSSGLGNGSGPIGMPSPPTLTPART